MKQNRRDTWILLIAVLFYGIVLVMIIYNSFLFLALRDAGFFYQVSFLMTLSLCLAAYDGLLQQYLWPQDKILDPRVIIFFMAASNVAMVKFAGAFLKTEARVPGAHKVILCLTWATGLLTISTLLLPYDRIIPMVEGFLSANPLPMREIPGEGRG